jgi:hypothetical protein
MKSPKNDIAMAMKKAATSRMAPIPLEILRP